MFERAEALNPVGYKIGLELIVKCGCTHIVELPVNFSDRRFGQSKLGLREQINYLRHLKWLADFKFGGWSQLGQFCVVDRIRRARQARARAFSSRVSFPILGTYMPPVWWSACAQPKDFRSASDRSGKHSCAAASSLG